MLKKASGDLDGDGSKDLVFVIQGSNSKRINGQQSDNDGVINLNPRILAIYFKNKKTGQFLKQRQLDSFIPLIDNHSMDEPLSDLEISKKGIHLWSTSGRETADYRYSFSYCKNDFQLIEFELSTSNRSNGNTVDYNFDFIGKLMTITKGNFTKDDPASVQRQKIHLKTSKTLKSFAKPFLWSFMGVDI